jgi:hypothetical protein
LFGIKETIMLEKIISVHLIKNGCIQVCTKTAVKEFGAGNTKWVGK